MRSGTPSRTRVNELTVTQQRVLALIAEGKTNYEIGQQLGITLDGAKYHVTEILNKLGVDSREDAAEWWRREQRRPAARLSRAIALPAAKWVLVGTAAVAAVVVVVALLAALTKDDPPAVPHIQAAFLVGDDQAAPRRIVTVDDDGNQRQVGEERKYVAVDWSPDGQKLFAMELDGKTPLVAWIFDSVTGDALSWPPGLLQWWKWSPDSSSLALLLTDRLVIVTPGGREVASLSLPPSTEHSFNGWPLLWSPDSAWVAANDRTIVAVLNVRGEGRVLDAPSDFAARNVLLVSWPSASELQITDPAYAGRPRPDARSWVADVTVSPLAWRNLPYAPPPVPSEADLQDARKAASVPDGYSVRSLVTAEGANTAYVFSSPVAGNRPAAVAALVVRTATGLTRMTVPSPVTVVGVPRNEVSVVVVESQ